MRRIEKQLSVFIMLLLLAGCSSNGRLAVSGDVTLDGKPLEKGTISFLPAPGNNGPSAGGQIADGRFLLSADRGLMPGKYTVTIQAFRPSGRMVNDPDVGNIPEIVPIVFREGGHFDAVVTADGDNRFQFHLTSAAAH